MDTRHDELTAVLYDPDPEEKKEEKAHTFTLTSTDPTEQKNLLAGAIASLRDGQFEKAIGTLNGLIQYNQNNFCNGLITASYYLLRAEAQQQLAMQKKSTDLWEKAKCDFLMSLKLTKGQKIPRINLGNDESTQPIDVHDKVVTFLGCYAAYEVDDNSFENAEKIYNEANKLAGHKNIDLLLSTALFYELALKNNKKAEIYKGIAEKLINPFVLPLQYMNPEASSAIEMDMQSLAIQIYNADMAFRNNDVEKAKRLMDLVIHNQDSIEIDGNTYFLMARIHYKLNDFKTAWIYCEKVRASFTDALRPAHNMLLAMINVHLGEYEIGINYLYDAIKDIGSTVDPDLAHIIVLSRLRHLNNQDIIEFTDLKKKADLAIKNNELNDAIKHCYLALRILPTDPACYAMLSLAEELRDPKKQSCYVNLIYIADQLDKLTCNMSFSLSQLTAYLCRTDNLGSIYLDIVQKFEGAKKSPDEQYKILKTTLDLILKNPTLQQARLIGSIQGRIYYGLKDLTNAKKILTALDASTSSTFRSETIKLTLAWVHFAEKNWSKALQYAIDAVYCDMESNKISPADIDIFSLISTNQLAQSKSKEHKTAKSDIKKVDNLIEDNQLDKAIPLVRKILDLYPGDYRTHLTLAKLHLRNKNHIEAMKYATTALRIAELNPSFSDEEKLMLRRIRRDAAAKEKKLDLCTSDHDWIINHLTEQKKLKQLQEEQVLYARLFQEKKCHTEDALSNLYLLAEAFYKNSNIKAAREQCSQLISDGDKYAHHYLLLALCRAKENEWDAALDLFHKADEAQKSLKKSDASAHKQHLNACRDLIAYELKLSHKESDTLSKIKKDINAALQEKKLKALPALCIQGLDILPIDPELHVALIMALELNYLGPAIAPQYCINNAVLLHDLRPEEKISTKTSEPLSLTQKALDAHVSFAHSEYKNVIKLLQDQDILLRSHVHSLVLALAYFYVEKFHTAKDQLLALRPENSIDQETRFTYLALIALKENRFCDAIDHIHIALTPHSGLDEQHSAIAKILPQIGEKIQKEKKAAESQHALLKKRLGSPKDTKDPIVALHLKIFDDPGNATLYHARAMCYLAIKDHEKANKDLTIAYHIENSKDSPDFNFLRQLRTSVLSEQSIASESSTITIRPLTPKVEQGKEKEPEEKKKVPDKAALYALRKKFSDLLAQAKKEIPNKKYDEAEKCIQEADVAIKDIPKNSTEKQAIKNLRKEIQKAKDNDRIAEEKEAHERLLKLKQEEKKNDEARKNKKTKKKRTKPKKESPTPSPCPSTIIEVKEEIIGTKIEATPTAFKAIDFADLPKSFFTSSITLPDSKQYPSPMDVIQALMFDDEGKKTGHSANFIGGSMLSLALKKDPNGDFDEFTNAPATFILERLKKWGVEEHPNKKGLFSFHRITHVAGSIDLYAIGSKTDEENTNDRDFTICSIKGTPNFSEKKLELYDLTGKGQEHADKGIIDTNIDPLQSFKDDPTRMLREVKFETNYAFRPSERVKKAIPERITDLVEFSQKNPIPTNNILEYLLCNGTGLKNFKRLLELNIPQKLFPSVPFQMNGSNNILLTTLFLKWDAIAKETMDKKSQILKMGEIIGTTEKVLLHRTHQTLMTDRPINLLYAYFVAISTDRSASENNPLIQIAARCSIFEALIKDSIEKLEERPMQTPQPSVNVNIVNIVVINNYHLNPNLFFTQSTSSSTTSTTKSNDQPNEVTRLFSNQ